MTSNQLKVLKKKTSLLLEELGKKYISADLQQRRLYTETNSLEGFYSALFLAHLELQDKKYSEAENYVQIAFNILKNLPLCINSSYLVNILKEIPENAQTKKHHELMASIFSLRCERATVPLLKDFFAALSSYQTASDISSVIKSIYLLQPKYYCFSAAEEQHRFERNQFRKSHPYDS